MKTREQILAMTIPKLKQYIANLEKRERKVAAERALLNEIAGELNAVCNSSGDAPPSQSVE